MLTEEVIDLRRRLILQLVFTAVLTALLALPVHALDYAQVDALIISKDVAEIERAIEMLEEHLGQQPQDGEALWLAGKAYLYLGDRTDGDRLRVFEKGKEYTDKAVELVPDSPDAHYWLAALIGRIGQTRGILSSLFMVRPMKDALDRALELDENYAPAYWVLSQLYQQAPGFPLSIGSKKQALENAQRAVELEPQNLEFQLQLARALDHNGKEKEARDLLQQIRSNPALKADPEILQEVEEQASEWKL
jgi:tetratricopeptide (TPR) repeat protein